MKSWLVVILAASAAWGQSAFSGPGTIAGSWTQTGTSGGAGTADVYVSPGGSDSNPCTMSTPCLTPQHASAVVRGMPGGKRLVTLRGGDYLLSSAWTLDSGDSGNTSTPIVYQAFAGETPVISGGRKIAGTWTVEGTITCGGTCTAYYIDLDANPADPGHYGNFEALFYNGERRYRPRSRASYLTQGAPVCMASSSTNCNVQGACSSGQFECFDRINRDASDSGTSFHGMSNAGAGIHDVELLIFENWTMSRLRATSLNSDGNTCTTTATRICATGKTTSGNVYGPMGGHRYLLENVKESLNQPGQWYLDRCLTDCSNGPQLSWRLYYLAKSGENPNSAAIYVPQIAQLVSASGLHDVTFSGVTFAHDNYVVPDAGQQVVSHASNIPAAISCVNCTRVKFDANTFSHLENWALEVIGAPAAASATTNEVTNNVFADLGTGAVRLGQLPCSTTSATCPNGADTDANVAQWTRVENNLLRGGQRVLAGGIGLAVWIGNSHHNTVKGNTINDWYSGGIGVGATLNNPSTQGTPFSHDNLVTYNLIYDIGQGVLRDHGGLHTATSNQTGNVFANNVIHDVSEDLSTVGSGGHGIYLDQGSSNWTITNNLVYRLTDSAFFINNPTGARNNSVTNNIFAHVRKGLVRKNGDETYQAFSMRKNIFYFALGNPDFGVQYEGAKSQWWCNSSTCSNYFDFDSNVYFDADPSHALASNTRAFFTTDGNGGSFNPVWLTWAGWQTLGEDTHSVIQDPAFANPTYSGGAGDNYSFVASGPYQSIGFVPFDPTQAGAKGAMPAAPATVPAGFPLQLLNKDTDWGNIQHSSVMPSGLPGGGNPELYRAAWQEGVDAEAVNR